LWYLWGSHGSLQGFKFIKRVEIKEDVTLSNLVPDKRPAIVEILTKDGHKFRERVNLPKGEPENPLSDEELKKKFAELASCCRSKEEVESILNIVENMEEKIGKIFKLLS